MTRMDIQRLKIAGLDALWNIRACKSCTAEEMLAALREVAQQVQRDLETIERRAMQHNPHRTDTITRPFNSQSDT
jgi:hypothetical protein